MPKFDAVVIGAGNGGLAAACRLAKAGKKTLLIEQHNLPGGVASSFRRGRFEFETALHELCEFGSAENPGGCRQTIVDEFGLDINWYMVPDNFRVITTARDGSPIDATLPCGRENFINKMEEYVPGCRESVEKFFDLGTETLAAGKYMTASGGHPDSKLMQEKYPNFLRTAAYPVNRVLKALKMPDKAQDIMNTYWGYLGVDADHLSFMQYVNMVCLYVNHGAWIPEKTSNQLTTGLLERFRAMGGTAWFNCRAEEILFDEEEHVNGLRTTAGTVDTRYIICNANPSMVYANMVPQSIVPDRERKLAAARRYSARMFVVYMGLNKSAEELGLKDYSYFLPQSADSVKEYESLKRIETNKYNIALCYNVVNPKASPEGTCIVSLTTTYMEDCWSEIDPKDYVKTKNKVASDMIDWFEEKTGIIIRPYIEEFEVATPWTFCRYASVPQGAAYGYELRDWDNMMPRMMMMREEYPIKGLRFCGAASIRGDGFNSAIFSGDMMGKLTLAQMKEEGC
ncbi:MAG: FAD-dependent oxidoreductase [Candidatus Limivicinus sp.]|nr:FAD-dependent oxidoreductase [Candidatus Limivicinus sp.]